jgi:hypothetical protein
LFAIDLCFEPKHQPRKHHSLDTKSFAIVSTTGKFIYTNHDMMAKLQQRIPSAMIENNILTCNSVSLLYMEDVLMMLLSVPSTTNLPFKITFVLHENYFASLKHSDLIWENKKDSPKICKSIIRIIPKAAETKGMLVLHHIIQSLIYIQLLGLSISVFCSRHILSYLTIMIFILENQK